MTEHGLIRTIYLYLFALVGLFMLTFSTAAFIGSILNTFVWPDEFVSYEMKPSAPATDAPAPVSIEEQKSRFRTEQRNRFKNTATTSVGFILVGLPLWLFHWKQIQADRTK